MPTLDSQVHAYERNHPGRPWIGTLYGPPEVTGDQMAAAMGFARLQQQLKIDLLVPPVVEISRSMRSICSAVSPRVFFGRSDGRACLS